ncbi:MAG: DUF4845 domain-containing protein [Pseudomonadales bacterium]
MRNRQVSNRPGSRSPAGPFPTRQKGLSAIGWIAMLLLLASAITLTLKLLPHYIDFRTMQSVLSGLPAEETHHMARGDVYDLIKKRFKINNLRDFDIKKVIELKRDRDHTTLLVNYERRENLFMNVDVVITFSDQFVYP